MLARSARPISLPPTGSSCYPAASWRVLDDSLTNSTHTFVPRRRNHNVKKGDDCFGADPTTDYPDLTVIASTGIIADKTENDASLAAEAVGDGQGGSAQIRCDCSRWWGVVVDF